MQEGRRVSGGGRRGPRGRSAANHGLVATTRGMSGSRRRKLARQIGATGSPKLPGPCPPDLPGSRQALVAMLVIAAATVLAYSNSFDASFHFDDLRNIVRNQSLRELGRQWPPSGNRWVGFLSFALNYRFGGLEVFGYHLVNLLIHVCNGLLVFWLAAITLRTPALRSAEAGPLVRGYLPLAAGLLFALHPVQTQAVTYIVQRFASLAALFFLLSLVLYAQARISLEADPPSRAAAGGLYGLSLIAAAAAMKTKEISFTLPLVAAMYEWLFFGARRRFLLIAPLAAAALLLLPIDVITHGANFDDLLGDPSQFAAETPEISRGAYLLTQSRVVVTYLRLLFLPVGQNLDYDVLLSHSVIDPRVLFALAILLALAAVAVFLLRRARETNRGPGLLLFFGIVWFFVTLSVESSIIPIRDVIFEHRMYLPSAGAAVALGAALLWAIERMRLRASLARQAAVGLLLTTGPLGVATYARNLVWKDDLTLWGDAVSKSPGKARPHNNLGKALIDSEATSEAVNELLAALKIAPPNADALSNLGVAYAKQGRADEAIAAAMAAVAIKPADARAHNTLGTAYEVKSQIDDAVREYREAIRLAPSVAGVHYNLCGALLTSGRFGDAVQQCRELIRLAPSSAEGHNLPGGAFQASGQLDDAVREYREAIRVEPSMADAHYNLGNAYQGRGQLDDAVREYSAAIRLGSSTGDTHCNLGNAYRAMGRFDDAAHEYREAIRIDPSMAEAREGLAAVLLKQRRTAKDVEEKP